MIKHAIRSGCKVVLTGLTKFRAGRFLYQQFLEVGMNVNVTVNHCGVKMSFSAPNSLTNYRCESFSEKEPETLTWLESMPKGAVLWDVGANVGLYSIYAAMKVKARVFAFEPSVFNLELLARNIFRNRLQEKVIIVPIALNDALGPNMFNMSSTTWGGALSTFSKNFDQHGDKLNSIFEYQTMGMTMDEASRLLNIPAPGYIKIDVDGLEHFILRGGTEILRVVDSVLIEIDDGFSEQAEESTLHLRNAGLTLYKKCNLGAGSQTNQWWVRLSS
jgi:FkbM family methyltransferase